MTLSKDVMLVAPKGDSLQMSHSNLAADLRFSQDVPRATLSMLRGLRPKTKPAA